MRPTVKRCSISLQRTRSLFELRPKPTRRSREASYRYHLCPTKIICADWWHEKEDRHLDPGGVRDVRGRRVRGHPLWVSLHRCASGTRLEAQTEAGGVPSHGMMGGDLGRAVKCYFDKDADLKDTSRWQTWRLHRIWPAVLLQRAKPGRFSSR